ncbi:hypothetical protein F5Y15DRAFT_412976 [Xylariaceae sp. FL0016]|nr:hypothetical protein F5Y15DRAFT_412976 [Xylariaceae sp. FL0016]
MALDVSYADGFTVPIVCGCDGIIKLGCNLDLLAKCPQEYKHGAKSCRNPHRSGLVSGVQNLFADCEALAYTYAYDDVATVNGIPGCPTNVTCCVGTACPPHPMQRMCPDQWGVAHHCTNFFPGSS